jgi:tight adherence protein B
VLPRMLGRDRRQDAEVARIEAIATWAEMLRDTLTAGAGLEQAILATAEAAPTPIRVHVGEVAARIRRGDRLGGALRDLAADLADPTADLVIAALVMAAEQHARSLADLLGELAGAARAQASMRLRVAAGRARIRTSVRVIITVTLAMAALLVLVNRPYLSPYSGTTGQLVLLIIGALFAASFTWLDKISRARPAQRYLTQLHALQPAHTPRPADSPGSAGRSWPIGGRP